MHRWFPLAVVVATASPGLAGTGNIWLSNTAYPDSIVIEATITDTGGREECGWIAITRGGNDVFYIERQIGATITRRFVDTQVQHNTLYCYGVALRFLPAPILSPCGDDLCMLFDCFRLIETCTNTGPNPAFLGQGLLSTRFPDGSPVDDNETRALLYPCNKPSTTFIALHVIPTEAQQYLDTNTAVDVYGTWWCCWAQGVWLLAAQAVEPHTCVVSIDERPWGQVKALYEGR